MKFSEITESSWRELSPYMDTCLLPLTGLSGLELPYEATGELERLRDMLDRIEIPFKGRTVTYPACHYLADSSQTEAVEALCRALKRTGFRFVIIVTARAGMHLSPPSADLVVAPSENGAWPSAEEISLSVRTLWTSPQPADRY